jgi:hypothetical protein
MPTRCSGFKSRAGTRVTITLAGFAMAAYGAPNAPFESLSGSILGHPVTVSWGSNRLDTFVVGSDHQLYHKAWDGNRWLPSATGYEPLGGIIRAGSSPGVTSWGNGRLDVVMVGSDGHLYHKGWEGGRWLPSATGYESLGGDIRAGSSPAIVSWVKGRLDIAVVGTDRQLYHKAWDGSRWLPSPSGYEPLGGLIRDGSSPSVAAWGPNRLDIVVVGDDRQVQRKTWDGNNWLPSASEFTPLGGTVRDGSSPNIVSRGPGRLDVFIAGDDKGLDHKAWETNQWLPSATDFEHLGGGILDGTSPSATAWGNSAVSTFVIGEDKSVYHKAWDGSRWWEYENLGGAVPNSPAAVSWGAGRMDVFVVASDNGLYHKARNSFEWLTETKVETAPVRGATKWAVILCKTADHPEEPQAPAFFRNFFTEEGNGLGGMFDYWRDMSFGAISLAGSQVKGWYSMPQTLDQLNALSRRDKVLACVSAANGDFHDGTSFYAIAAMFNTPSVDSGAAGSATIAFNGVTKAYPVVALASSVWTGVFTAHEMGHGYGLDHSWSRMPDIEYGDPYDIMSALGVKTFKRALSLFGDLGPGLTGAYRESLGWIPPDRIFSTSLAAPATITLAPLEQSGSPGFLMAKIFAFGRSDRYYTAEFRSATGWNQGFSQDSVLIHEILPDRHSYLINDDGQPEHRIGQPFRDGVNRISIVVLQMNATQATIQIVRLP